jgi:hypothetical protein
VLEAQETFKHPAGRESPESKIKHHEFPQLEQNGRQVRRP